MLRTVATREDVELSGVAVVTSLGEAHVSGEAELRETATPDRDAMPLFEVDVDDTVATATRPALTGRQLVAPLAVTIGSRLNPGEVAPGTFYDASLDGATVFGFSMPRRRQHDGADTDEILGTPRLKCGVPPGKDAIDLEVVYLTSSGPVTVPLVTNGIAENTSANLLQPSGELRFLNCTDALGRYDKQAVELHHPPGHGLTRAEVVVSVLELLDPVPAYAIVVPGDGPTYKEITLTKQNAVSFLQQYLEVVGLAIGVDAQGVFTLRDLRPPTFDSFEHTFAPGDVTLDGDIGDDSSTEGPTGIEVSGAKQITHDGIGLRSEVTTVEIYRIFAPHFVEFEIDDTGGTLAASTFSQLTPELQLVERIVTTTTFELQTVVAELKQRFTFYNIERSVAQIDTTAGALEFHVGVWVDTANGPGQLDYVQRFRETERIQTTHTYNDDGYLSRTQVLKFEWYNPQRSIAQTLSGGLTYHTGVEIDFNGRGRLLLDEKFRLTQRTTIDYSITADNFIDSESETVEGYRIRPSARTDEDGIEVFAGNEYSTNLQEQFDPLSVKLVTYSPTSKTTHKRTTFETDAEGVTVEIKGEDVGGYLPAAAKRDAELPDPALYPNGRVASRREQQEFEVTVSSEALEECRQIWVRPVSNNYLENEDEAEAYARFLLAESASYAVTFAVPVNALVITGQRVDLDLRPTGPRESLRVDRVQHREAPDSDSGLRLVTFVDGRAYPDIGL